MSEDGGHALKRSEQKSYILGYISGGKTGSFRQSLSRYWHIIQDAGNRMALISLL